MKILLTLVVFLLLAHTSTAQQIDPLDLDNVLREKENLNNLFGVGFGIGNPITNVTISLPYLDIEFGYGGFNGLHPNNFTPYIIGGIDVMFKEELYQNTIMGGGFGVGVDWSQEKPTNSPAAEKPEQNEDEDEGEDGGEDLSQTTPQNRLGIVLRLPISLEYSFLKNIVIGFKAVATLGGIMLLDSMSMEGMRFGFFGVGYLKIYM
ncbi:MULTISPECIES: DUF3996 domain-containing protein [unclassified Borrelia]|uniref:DUF3996 domain-containing protein n=1 Tax=unclassified Borrelia TaxID=2649934 RepID=UPI001E3F2A46|nr:MULTISPECIES: DUF3996 domain-containing protein [unclassified Borrelia]UGQ16087.1 DUF3996 domain-containing protein [Borrelia sp. RT5S]UGQ17200.1 DUF3996 domain-containing protein [Borrelia sp. RT1S]